MTGGQALRVERPVFGALLVVVASAFFAMSGLFVQLAAPGADHAVIVFMGFAVGGAVVIPLALSRGFAFLVTRRPRLILLRSVVGLAQIATLFVALQSISLLDGMLLREAAPLWVPVLGLLLFGERMPAPLWLPIVLGFAGMAMVLDPEGGGFVVGYFFALANGLLFALQSILTRRLDVAGEPVLRILFYLYLVCMVGTVVPAALEMHRIDALTWAYLVGSGLCLLLSTACLLEGFGHGPAYLLAPFGYSAVGFSALIDWAAFGLLPTLQTVAGLVVIVGAGCLLLYLDRRLAGKTARTDATVQ